MEICDSLPKLLASTDWGDRESVAQIYLLLKRWPTLEPEVSTANPTGLLFQPGAAILAYCISRGSPTGSLYWQGQLYWLTTSPGGNRACLPYQQGESCWPTLPAGGQTC